MGAELILDILLLDVEYLAAILSRNPELAVLHLDARTDGEQVGSERGYRRAAAALLHIFELVEHKARAGLFVQINGGLRYILRAHALIAHLAGSYDLERDTGARALRAIIEEFMLDIMYEIPKDDNIGTVTITREYIEGTGGPRIEIRNQAELPMHMIEEKPQE